MVNKPKIQGTKWESEVVKRAMLHGLYGERIAEGGSKDIGDVYLFNEYADDGDIPIVALAWKRLVKTDTSRRTADGEKEVVVLPLDDFLYILQFSPCEAVIECKATQQLNVTRVLGKARKKAL